MASKPFWEYLSDFLLFLIFSLFAIYSYIATVFLLIFFPLTKYLVKRQLSAYGITINGDKGDIQVFNEKRFFTRVAIEKSYGLLDSRLDGDWDTKDFRTIMVKIMRARKHSEVLHPLWFVLDIFNLQTKSKAWLVGQKHYDDATSVIEAMIDSNLQYTCGYWKNAKNLEEAQIAKMDLIARKLRLEKGMRVLDLGCGYGTLGKYLMTNYGVKIVGCSISKEQIKYAKNLCKGFPDAEFLLCDYRDIKGKFDRVVSVGLLEHIGAKNYRAFFQLVRERLKDDGIFVLHSIVNLNNAMIPKDLWFNKYLFQNSYCPHYMEVCKAMNDLWVIEDFQNLGFDYSLTMTEWEKKFDASWPQFRKQYGDRFYKIWKMYLQGGSAIFETRALHLGQLVLSPDGIKGGYHAAR